MSAVWELHSRAILARLVSLELGVLNMMINSQSRFSYRQSSHYRLSFVWPKPQIVCLRPPFM